MRCQFSVVPNKAHRLPDHGSIILRQIEGTMDVQLGQCFLECCDSGIGQPPERLVEDGCILSLDKPQHT